MRVGQQFRAELLRAQKQKEENQFFSSRVVDILKKQKELPQIPPNLLRVVGEEYKTLAEDAAESAAKTHDAIAMDPLIKKIMEVFPGATIDNITPAARPEPDPKNADGFDSTNEEKISG